MTDALHAFEPIWADMAATKQALLGSLQGAGLIGSAEGDQQTAPERISAAAERARRDFRKRRLANALRGRSMPAIPECAHASVAEVESAGEVVAGLCRDCDAQLSAMWFTCTHEHAERIYLGPEALSWPSIGESVRLALRDCRDCGTRWWDRVTIAEWVEWL